MNAAPKLDLSSIEPSKEMIATAMCRLEPLICETVSMIRIAMELQMGLFQESRAAPDDQFTLRGMNHRRDSVEFAVSHAFDMAEKVKREFYRACEGLDPQVGY